MSSRSFLRLASMLLLFPPVAPAPIGAAELPKEGLASRYPGDAGIERDPAVVFVENFEEDSVAALCARWETATDRGGMSFSEETPTGSAGKRSLIMERTQGPGAQLYRRLKNASG